MIVKTRASLAEPVREAVKELHTYTTPAVMVLPVESVDADYHAWIVKETGGPIRQASAPRGESPEHENVADRGTRRCTLASQ